MPAPALEDPLHIELVMLIWRDYWFGNDPKKGIARSELIEQLRADYRRRGVAEDALPAVGTVKKKCRILSLLPDLIEVSQGQSRGGAKEHVYHISEPTGLGWPVTAKILTEIPTGGATAEFIADRLAPRQLRNKRDFPVFSRAAILGRIRWATEVGYLQLVDGDSIGTDARFRREIEYIKRVAKHCVEGEDQLCDADSNGAL